MKATTDHPARVRIYDTTLRDGTQREGISLSARDKLRIAARLDDFGVSFIEGGWPGSNPKDAELFERARDFEWKNALLTAFGSTRHAGIPPEDDLGLKTLVQANTAVCTIFGKTSAHHVRDVLRAELDENLDMIEESVAYLGDRGRRVIYDAEHFFDGYEEDPEYALETLRAAVRGGAECVVLCDTNGGTMPWRVEEIVTRVRQTILRPVGIHAHNDGACAVANSLAAVRAGATHVQGTINGYGERCGNADLCSLIGNLELKLGVSCLPEGQLASMTEVSRFVAETANLTPDDHLAYVGRSAFAHKGGVHVAAIRRSERSYEHVDPTLVGNATRVVISELAGRGNVLSKAEELGMTVDGGKERELLEQIKQSEARGFSYEAAEASVALLIRRQSGAYEPPFSIVDHQVSSGRRNGGETFTEATMKVVIGESTVLTAAEGNGPVAALDAALRKALQEVLPQVETMHLVDYKVRILDGRNSTSATTRVLIDMRNETRQWTSVGASPNIIEASLAALVDGYEYGLLAEVEALPVTCNEAYMFSRCFG